MHCAVIQTIVSVCVTEHVCVLDDGCSLEACLPANNGLTELRVCRVVGDSGAATFYNNTNNNTKTGP